MSMPVQKPGRSKQNYQTPVEFLEAVRDRLQINHFSWDLAADAANKVAINFYTEADNSLRPELTWNPYPGCWAWLNPPYADIAPWVEKAAREAQKGAHIAILVPSSVGANWWRDWVNPYAYQTHLNGRIKFVGAKDYYPKDCSLLLYAPWQFMGFEIWNWNGSMSKLHESELSED
jgi:phage N-6-adenine-methyltransferase